MVLRVGEHRIDLVRRPVLQRLLDALARKYDQVVSVDELVMQVWEVEYHPLRHDNTLRVNVRRLRNLLAHTGLSIEKVSGGYRLLSPGEFQVEST